MKHIYRIALRTYLSQKLFRTRKSAHLSQAKMAEKLMIDDRCYSALEHGKSLCSTLTFILYLVFCCDDVDGLIRDLRAILLRTEKDLTDAS